MNDILPMAVVARLEHLVHIVLDDGWLETVGPLFNNLEKIFVNEFEDEVQSALSTRVALEIARILTS